MATCSITDPFVVDDDTFYKAVEITRKVAESKKSRSAATR
jgi:hypothetical protein